MVSKISAVRIKLLAAHVVQQALGNDAPPEKAAKLLGDAKLEPADVKAVVAALRRAQAWEAKLNEASHELKSKIQAIMMAQLQAKLRGEGGGRQEPRLPRGMRHYSSTRSRNRARAASTTHQT